MANQRVRDSGLRVRFIPIKISADDGPNFGFLAKYTGASMEILTLLCILSSRLYVGSSPQSSYDLRFLHALLVLLERLVLLVTDYFNVNLKTERREQ
jgi:hypothetical protein